MGGALVAHGTRERRLEGATAAPPGGAGAKGTFRSCAPERRGLAEPAQPSVPGLHCCFSMSVSRSPSACHKCAACVLETAIWMRVSRSTDDLASLVPRNLMRMLPMLSSL